MFTDKTILITGGTGSFGKKCIISAFFLQLSAKKNNKDYIKTLDTEQNADYTIMDWVYWLFNASLSKYHQEEKT